MKKSVLKWVKKASGLVKRPSRPPANTQTASNTTNQTNSDDSEDSTSAIPIPGQNQHGETDFTGSPGSSPPQLSHLQRDKRKSKNAKIMQAQRAEEEAKRKKAWEEERKRVERALESEMQQFRRGRSFLISGEENEGNGGAENRPEEANRSDRRITLGNMRHSKVPSVHLKPPPNPEDGKEIEPDG